MLNIYLHFFGPVGIRQFLDEEHRVFISHVLKQASGAFFVQLLKVEGTLGGGDLLQEGLKGLGQDSKDL